MRKLLDIRKYTSSDQQRFAELSGDYNPIHLDPIAARREIFGEVVVYGMHGVLSAISAYLAMFCKREQGIITLSKVKGRFPHPIYLNQTVKIYLVDERNETAKLQICDSKQLLTECVVEYNRQNYTTTAPVLSSSPRRQPLEPIALSLDEIVNRRGKIALYIDAERVFSLYPALASLSLLSPVASLLALTRLVGMDCPGLHSIFSSFDVDFSTSAIRGNFMNYEVTKVDTRVSKVWIAICGPSVHGKVDASYRPVPKEQPPMTEVQKMVQPHEFIGQRALIIGGSRGLGEVTAKIIAAGGGYPVITYRFGIEDANKVVEDIRKAGGMCQAVQCDVAHPTKGITRLGKIGIVPTHLYYYASAKIIANRGTLFDQKLFRKYVASYVDGLYRTYKACRLHWASKLVYFYPSSSFLDEKVRGFLEYSAAKSAGEVLCRYLERFDSNLSVLIKRLPRLATDQTIAILNEPAPSALGVLIEVVREMEGYERDE